MSAPAEPVADPAPAAQAATAAPAAVAATPEVQVVAASEVDMSSSEESFLKKVAIFSRQHPMEPDSIREKQLRKLVQETVKKPLATDEEDEIVDALRSLYLATMPTSRKRKAGVSPLRTLAELRALFGASHVLLERDEKWKYFSNLCHRAGLAAQRLEVLYMSFEYMM